MTEAGAPGAGLVLVVSDDPLVVERVAERLGADGVRARPLADYDLALEVVTRLRPDVVVLDQILEDPASIRLMRSLEQLGDAAPRVVLVRYATGPVGPFRTLHVTVVGGERWFDQVPAAVARCLG